MDKHNVWLDILPVIFGHVMDGITYKSIIFSCKSFKKLMESHHPSLKSKVCNQLLSLLDKYPNNDWSWTSLSCNPKIPIEYIVSHMDLPWNWRYMSQRSDFTTQFIDSHPDLLQLWEWSDISSSLMVTPKYLEDHIDYPWNWKYLTLNPNMTIEYIDSHREYPWNIRCLSRIVPMKYIDNHPEDDTEGNNVWCIWWDWEYVSMNPNLTMEYIELHPEKPWRWDCISQNRFLKK